MDNPRLRPLLSSETLWDYLRSINTVVTSSIGNSDILGRTRREWIHILLCADLYCILDDNLLLAYFIHVCWTCKLRTKRSTPQPTSNSSPIWYMHIEMAPTAEVGWVVDGQRPFLSPQRIYNRGDNYIGLIIKFCTKFMSSKQLFWWDIQPTSSSYKPNL
jgi:hypothetical protein